MRVDINTPVEDVLAQPGSKPLMIRLAQKVFELDSMDYFRAFSQFRKADDVAKLIEAKRKNIFNYSVCIQHTKTGVRYTKNTTAVLAAVDAAVEKRYDDIDLSNLGLVDGKGDPTILLKDLCPSMAIRRGKPAQKTQAPTKMEVAQQQKRVKPEVELPPEPVGPRADESDHLAGLDEDAIESEAVLLASGEVIQRIDDLSSALADALEQLLTQAKSHSQDVATKVAGQLEDEIGYVKSEVENTKAGVLGVASYLHVLDKNIRSIAQYFELELIDTPPEALALLRLSVPDDIEERIAESEENAPAPPTEEKKPDDSGIITYTREDLQAMELQELKTLAQSIGLSNAHLAVRKTGLIQRICKAAAIN